MGYVYILGLANGQYYVGSTDNIERRIIQHQSGRVISTKGKLPLEVLCVKQYSSLIQARQTEYKIKKMKSKKFIEQFMGD
ncbi:hypothetical protein AGMMS50249_3270 [candidate division SR1 bacterium]|nr:hypothetical protein AGMMS50249_3270 [candidate division SR1 bacterium]